GHVEDGAQGLLRAIIGMLVPGEVAEQGRGIALPAALGALIGEERLGPGEELVAIGAEAPVRRGDVVAGGDERVLGADARRQEAVEMPLAQPERGEDEMARRRATQQALQ